MVSALDEVAQARRLVEQAVQQLREEGRDVSLPPIGAMIEVPAAVYLAESLARQLDFLSVGTNDLSQYLLATDRNNPRVSGRLGTVHPAMLQALQLIVASAHRVGKPVTVCGELASDPSIALVLVGMGYDGLSINPTALLEVKAAIRGRSFHQMRSLAEGVLRADDPVTIRALLQEVQLGIAESSPDPGGFICDRQAGVVDL
jgi:phosphotransferase system enzyme I (PtsP)